MRRYFLFASILGLCALVWSGRAADPRPAAQALRSTSEAPSLGDGLLPRFEREPTFPKVPARWRMGFGSAVAVDDQDHVWILSRPKTLANPRSTVADTTSTPAPPVMEFDNDGNFVQAWGGESGTGYQWPSNEHGITVDHKGFVWIVGNSDGNANNPGQLPNDNQILKFTKDGKFVMAIGTSGQTGSNKTHVLRGATGLHVYPKTNELFVSDGYGNARIIVFDADTGAFKRMWGAYGRVPLDAADRPPRSAPGNDPYVAVAEVLQQFRSPVHDVRVSDDGLVYVSDRGNKRVQVFTTGGAFVAEQFVGLHKPSGLQARSVAFSPDPGQTFLYVAGAPVVYILNRRTLEVLGEIETGKDQTHPPGHQMAADHRGNIYLVQAELTGPDGSGGVGAQKFAFKGVTPRRPSESQ